MSDNPAPAPDQNGGQRVTLENIATLIGIISGVLAVFKSVQEQGSSIINALLYVPYYLGPMAVFSAGVSSLFFAVVFLPLAIFDRRFDRNVEYAAGITGALVGMGCGLWLVRMPASLGDPEYLAYSVFGIVALGILVYFGLKYFRHA